MASDNSGAFRFGLALVVIVTLLALASSAFGAAVAVTPRDAIERAIVERMGGNVAVLVEVLRSDVVSEPGLEARPDPAGRSGQPVRFTLTANGTRKGAAVATVDVQASHLRAARSIARGEAVATSDVNIVTGPLEHVAFRRLPGAQDVIGLRARRAIAPGEPLTAAVLTVPPMVQSGDEVSARVSIGHVQVNTVAVASGSGHPGDLIRVVSRGSRRPLKARITGPGAVEIVR